jgi:hypothetical protein
VSSARCSKDSIGITISGVSKLEAESVNGRLMAPSTPSESLGDPLRDEERSCTGEESVTLLGLATKTYEESDVRGAMIALLA